MKRDKHPQRATVPDHNLRANGHDAIWSTACNGMQSAKHSHGHGAALPHRSAPQSVATAFANLSSRARHAPKRLWLTGLLCAASAALALTAQASTASETAKTTETAKAAEAAEATAAALAAPLHDLRQPPNETAVGGIADTLTPLLAPAPAPGNASADMPPDTLPAQQPHEPPHAAQNPGTHAQPGEPAQAAPLSDSAARVYHHARDKLVQIRTLLHGQSSQSTVGSGFLVADNGLLITNYHVISGAALQPKRYRLVYTTLDGREGPLELLAFDVAHDLALVRVADKGFDGVEPLAFRDASTALQRGERIFALGNPLDVGFAVMEGKYNGLVERSFYPNIFFGGSLSGGMSGGPALDERGHIIGVNVATRRDGEQVSFLVPAEYALDLLQKNANANAFSGDVYAEITRQLTAHQAHLSARFLAQKWNAVQELGYRVPVPQEEFFRCWGRSSSEESKGMRHRSTQCDMDTQVFISARQYMSGLSLSHHWMDGSNIGALRFASAYSNRFDSEIYGVDASDSISTPAQCREEFIEHGNLPMRAVICMDAYKKLPGLYDLRVVLAAVNEPEKGVFSAFSANGVSFDNAMKLSRHFLEGFAWKP